MRVRYHCAMSDVSKVEARSKGGKPVKENSKQCTGITGNPDQQAALRDDAVTGCNDARCGIVEGVGTEGKQVKLTVNIGDSVFEVLSSNAFGGHVEESMIVAVAMPGSEVCEEVTERPMLLSAHHLGWERGSDAAAVVLPASFAVGDSAPVEKPKRVAEVLDMCGNTVVNEGAEAVYEMKKKKPTKEEKAAAKNAKIRAAKIAAGELDEDDLPELKKATKGELKKVKAAAKAKRDAGEACLTDDELEAAGFLAQ